MFGLAPIVVGRPTGPVAWNAVGEVYQLNDYRASQTVSIQSDGTLTRELVSGNSAPQTPQPQATDPTTASTPPPAVVTTVAASPSSQPLSPAAKPTFSASPAGLAGPSGRLYLVTHDVNIRDQPTSNSNLPGAIPKGAKVGVECKSIGETIVGPWGSDSTWDRVTFNGITGYLTDEWIDTRQGRSRSTKSAILLAPESPIVLSSMYTRVRPGEPKRC
jgi:hypothetical protein